MSQTVSAFSLYAQGEEYLQEIQRLTCLAEESDTNYANEREKLLQNNLDGAERGSPEAEFLRGEIAFYAQRYKVALQHYLTAQEIPHARFFCYRTSAFVARGLGRNKKAIHLAREALRLRNRDYVTLKLLEELITEEGPKNELQLLRSRLHEVIEEVQSGKKPAADPIPAVALGAQEFEELSNLFQEEESDFMHEEFHTGNTATLESDELIAMPINAADELNRLANSDYASTNVPTSRLLSDQFGLTLDAGLSLEERIRGFQRRQIDELSSYIRRASQRAQLSDNHLFVLHGWNEENEAASRSCLTHTPKTTGGYFIRWNGKGIAINPGRQFLDNFHKAGLHIKDIDFVIVTQDCTSATHDVARIYDLNYRVNKMDANLHIIEYYLNQQAHRQLAAMLKPHFKQERNSVHSLELYVDSPEVENVNLAEGITLQYFPTFSPDSEAERSLKSVGIRLKLEAGNLATTIGYVSGTAYSPALTHHLGNTDILVLGFGSTQANDYGKVAYNEDSLGFFGTHSLIEEIAPRLLVTSEFNGQDGDVRVEVAKKLRQEVAYQTHTPTVVLPADSGLVVDLETQRVLCSVTRSYVEPTQVHVVKTSDAFGKLNYLSSTCFL